MNRSTTDTDALWNEIVGAERTAKNPELPPTPSGGGHPSQNPSQKGRRWKLNWMSVAVALIALVGVGTLMYPSTASWWSQYNESKAIVAYQKDVKEDLPPGNTVQLERAHEYNDKLSTGEIVVGADSNKPVLLGEKDDDSGYWELLPGDYGIMGRLKIPAIDVDLPIYHGTSDEVLEHGVGHLQGTSLPVGGDDTHAVLTAHTGLAKATLFDDLKDVKLGDTFNITVFGEVLTYRAIDLQTVLPEETESLIIQQDQDLVTLVTCTPLGINTHRYLVTGERIYPTPLKDIEAAEQEPQVPRFPWWAVILPSAVVLAGIYVWRSGYPVKAKQTGEATEASLQP